jgi:HEAT repeat protein
VAAFERLMINPVKTDPGCHAKAAIADALYRIGDDDQRVFLRGIHHVQLEPVYGGRTDTACELRGVCALGLVRTNHPDVMIELADLLADPEAPVRVAAARALAYSENDDAAPLLRFKILTGDVEPEVVSECLTALLKVAPSSSLAFVARRLDGADASAQEAAALALGGSRLREAFAVLRQWWERTPDPARRRTALLAIAMLRHDQAIDFLLSVIAEGNGPNARDAIAALGLYRHDDTVGQRVRNAVERRRDLDLSAALVKAF